MASPAPAIELTPEEVAHLLERRGQAAADERAAAEAKEAEAKAEARAAEEAKATAAREAKARADAVRARRDCTRKDEADAHALVLGLVQVVKAIRSIRSRLSSDRDATAATGQILIAYLTEGGVLENVDQAPHRIRHAVGGESHALAVPERAAIALASTLLGGLVQPMTDDARGRAETMTGLLSALADVWTGHDTMAMARAELDAQERQDVEHRARAHADAHAARLGAAAAEARAKLAPPPQRRPQHRPIPLATDAASLRERERLNKVRKSRGLPTIEEELAAPVDLGGEILEDGDGAFVPEGSVEGLSEHPSTG